MRQKSLRDNTKQLTIEFPKYSKGESGESGARENWEASSVFGNRRSERARVKSVCLSHCVLQCLWLRLSPTKSGTRLAPVQIALANQFSYS